MYTTFKQQAHNEQQQKAEQQNKGKKSAQNHLTNSNESKLFAYDPCTGDADSCNIY